MKYDCSKLWADSGVLILAMVCGYGVYFAAIFFVKGPKPARDTTPIPIADDPNKHLAKEYHVERGGYKFDCYHDVASGDRFLIVRIGNGYDISIVKLSPVKSVEILENK